MLGHIEGRPYAQLICAGSDGENAARQTARIARGWRLKEVQPPLIVCTHAQIPEDILCEKAIPEEELARCRDLGVAIVAGLAMGIFYLRTTASGISATCQAVVAKSGKPSGALIPTWRDASAVNEYTT